MVQTHARGARSTTGKPHDNHHVDLVRGKGRGCIILLHGAPGVGKTSTAVFLRVLEYYSGILFLTTNRVGTFDGAFKSRVHLSLRYPALDEESTRKVWEMNLRRTISHKPDPTVKQHQILQFAMALDVELKMPLAESSMSDSDSLSSDDSDDEDLTEEERKEKKRLKREEKEKESGEEEETSCQDGRR
ncbi:hypothetical protein GP486_001794 [Trichoglossum hirsutum]|uniref:Uncharacterized protein n=1 Tax=Trichoglossum hirsutum TaxID=265104 RepID=A0A9P8LG61_9PEZI|nr:hypothetical protein GP486_001794 [Trichoglossum hirsutum]